MSYKTEQESFWAGEFGKDYIERNQSAELIASNTALFSKVLSRTSAVSSVIEFGPNIDMNLMAIRHLLPKAELAAVEINPQAAEQLREIEGLNVTNQSILEFRPEKQCDFVLIKGVLIHINPNELQTAYQGLYETSSRYICIAEYYNPSPVEIDYRGHQGKLFKRDFAGEIMDKYPDLKLLDYGFVYHRDPTFSGGDYTWFLLEK
jgi:pseudaminic acid biosynthesis-associated methylase